MKKYNICRNMKLYNNIFYLFALVSFAACTSESPTPIARPPEQVLKKDICEKPGLDKGTRKIGYDILNLTELGSFNDNLLEAKKRGMSQLNLHLWWSQIETSEGVYQDPYGSLGLLNHYANTEGLEISLIISAVDIPSRATPDYLNSVKFDNSLMATRYKALLDYIFSVIDPSNVVSLSVDNEIDAYNWGLYGDTLSEFSTFINNVSTHSVFTNDVDLAFTSTLYGLTSSSLSAQLLALEDQVDLIHVTYYPLDENFKMHEPEILNKEMGELLDLVKKPIYLQEIGYATSTHNNSNEQKQAQFFCQFFNFWDQHQNQIPRASILRFIDTSVADAENTAILYGLPGHKAFIEYIRTLGLRTYDDNGSDKAAMDVILNQTQKRGW